jgi:hypothetical protein
MGYKVKEEGSVTNNLDKLVAGRISVYADIETIVDNTLRKHKLKYAAVKKIPPALKEKVYYLLISKGFAAKHPRLTERIWAAVRDVQTTDVYQEMLKKYEN